MASFVMQRSILVEEKKQKEVVRKSFEDIKSYLTKKVEPSVRYVTGYYYVDMPYHIFPSDKVYQNDLKTFMELIAPFYSNQLPVPFRVVVTEKLKNEELVEYSVIITSEITSRSGKGYFEEAWLEFTSDGKLIESEYTHWSECGYPPSTYSELNRVKQEIQKLTGQALDSPLDILKRRNKIALG